MLLQSKVEAWKDPRPTEARKVNKLQVCHKAVRSTAQWSRTRISGRRFSVDSFIK